MDFTKIIDLLYVNTGFLAIICLSFSICLSLINIKKLKLPIYRLLFFLIWNLIIEVLARIAAYSGVNNLLLLHIYTLGEFILFSWFYKSLLNKPDFLKRKFNYLIGIGSILIILYSLLFYNLGDYNPGTKTAVQITIITFAILYFYNLSEDQFKLPKMAKSLRLINSAVLIYYSGSLFIFMCSQMLRNYPEWIKPFWAFNAVLNLIFQLLILRGIWIVIFKKTPSS